MQITPLLWNDKPLITLLTSLYSVNTYKNCYLLSKHAYSLLSALLATYVWGHVISGTQTQHCHRYMTKPQTFNPSRSFQLWQEDIKHCNPWRFGSQFSFWDRNFMLSDLLQWQTMTVKKIFTTPRLESGVSFYWHTEQGYLLKFHSGILVWGFCAHTPSLSSSFVYVQI